MPRPRDPNKKVQLTIRLRPTMKKEVLKLAKRRKQSASELVGQALQLVLDDEDSATT